MRSPGSIVVNEALARSTFPGENPIGRRVLGEDDSEQWTITGVVGNIRGGDLGSEPGPLIYRCICQEQEVRVTPKSFLIRTAGDPHAAIRAVEEQVRAVDRNLPAFDIRTMDERLSEQLAPQRFQLALIGIFAVIALVLSALGVYGVLSYLVTRRTREIGIRMAIGASPSDVAWFALREALGPALAGVVVGMAGSLALYGILTKLVVGVQGLDLAALAFAPAALMLVALAASVVPLRRAMRVDPVTALRFE
jgi:putative ABC transport system permease protein